MSRELFGQTDHGAKDSVDDDDDDGDAKQIKLVNEVIVAANAKVPPKAVCAMYVRLCFFQAMMVVIAPMWAASNLNT